MHEKVSEGQLCVYSFVFIRLEVDLGRARENMLDDTHRSSTLIQMT